MNLTDNKILPLVPLRGLVVFPYMLIHFDVIRKKSILALENAMANGQLIFLSAQKNPEIEVPSVSDVYSVGTVARIKQMLKLPGDSVRVLVEGIERGNIELEITSSPYISVSVSTLKYSELAFSSDENEALRRKVLEIFDGYARASGKISGETIASVSGIRDLDRLADVIASNVLIEFERKQDMLAETDPCKRLIILASVLTKEIDILKIEQRISSMVKGQMDKNQRDYYLREQLKAIESELGDEEGTTEEIAEYRRTFKKLGLPDGAMKKINKELDRLKKMQSGSADAAVLRGYLDTVSELPWNKKTTETTNIENAEKILDNDHFGLEKVKERIIEHLAVRELSPDIKSPILCLVGPPGVGKTSIASSIARALNRKFVRISLGGIRDEAEIRGHRKTYVGAMPGRVINAVKTAGSSNALVLLDEIDKMSTDFKGDPSAALLEVLDKEQNSAFRDHYIEIPFDLSDVMFITTANTLDTVSRPLLDRMEVIEISGYTDIEKFNIAKKYLVPKQRKNHGLTARQLRFTDEAICDIINYYTRESGVRSLERSVADVCRKAAKAIVSGEYKSVTVSKNNLLDFLGGKKYLGDKAEEKPEIGTATGLAWTSVGGVTLPVEVNVMDGNGKIELTGQLGDVMKESAKAAISYIRANSSKLGVDGSFYKTKDIHVHVPEGATPKDGPSAGITMATAIVSALSGVPVKNTVAMTGEITLRGKVLPIGGLKEKALAAYRIGIKSVIIPHDNSKDLEEIPQSVMDDMTFIPVKSIDDVLSAALADKETYRYIPSESKALSELRQ
ncbi:MAG: endopeptidase La [Clostridia bacterium]|nr:endopeptidase La [Clostridia bacterium]